MKRGSVILLLFIALVISAICYAKTKDGLTVKDAQKLLTKIAGINLKSSQVKVESVSAMGSSAVVVAQVQTAFRLAKQSDGTWKVVEVRTGDRQWQDIDELGRALNNEKSARAKVELELLSNALEAFQREHGFYVVADSEAVLVDHI
jgi:predicted lipoprotein with Yx(FWY)xxD motif